MTRQPAQRLPEHQAAGPGAARPDLSARPGAAAATDAGERRAAALSYLSAPVLGPFVPLAIFLLRRKSGYARRHSAQALNLSLTMLLYGVCILIAGAVLALDSTAVAVAAGIAAAAVIWPATLACAIMAWSSASRGRFRRIPGWICASIVR